MTVSNLEKLDDAIAPILAAARIPGGAIAIVSGGETVFAKGYGRRDEEGLPVTADTLYPIASTTKAMNGTLLGILVDEGLIGWDVPVQHYLPRFRLADPVRSPLVTIRDLLTMRTGLPRHDWLWLGNPTPREDLAERFQHLELTAGFRERFQYNNLLVTLAGHVAEVVTGSSWNVLLKERLLDPLLMVETRFTPPSQGDFTRSWSENGDRQLTPYDHIAAECTAPSGGAIYSTVREMAHWLSFNLNGGYAQDGRQLIKPETLAEIRKPQMVMGAFAGLSAQAAYGLGWMIDPYNGLPRICHGGDLHQVNSEVAFFPRQNLGMVSFVNFGSPGVAALINQHVIDTVMGVTPETTIETKLAGYEKMVEDRRTANQAARRVENTAPSHPRAAYSGIYNHPGYGEVLIEARDDDLTLRRGVFEIPLEHWHYDSWVARDASRFWIHGQHPFERSNRFQFGTDADGDISTLTTVLDTTTAPIRFQKRTA